MANSNRLSTNRLSTNRITGKSAKTTKSFSEKTNDSIKNYKKRIRSVGKDEELDNRNAIEKFFNLPEGQNVLFDIGEIISRPQQALLTGLDDLVTGGDFAEGLAEGWSGKRETSGGQLLRDLGMRGSGEFNLLDKDSWDESSTSDFLGFAIDLFADPIDLALWGTTVATGGATAPIALGKEAADAARTIDKVSDIAQATNKASDVAQKTRITFAPFQKGSKSTLDLALGATGKAIKKTANLGDNLLTKGLTKLDDLSASKVAKLADKGIDVSQIKPSNAAESYKYLKKTTKGVVDATKQLPNDLVNKFRKTTDKASLARTLAEEQLKGAKDDIAQYAKKAMKYDSSLKGLTEEQQFRKVAEDIGLELEQRANNILDGSKFFNNLSSKNKSFEGTVESVNDIKNVLDTYASRVARSTGKENKLYTISADGTKITINTKNIDMNTLKNSDEIRNAFNKITLNTKTTNYTPEQLTRIQQLESNKEFMDLVKSVKNRQGNISDVYKAFTGVDYSEITNRPDYYTAARESDIGKAKVAGGRKAISSKKYKNVTESKQAHQELMKAKSAEARRDYITKNLKENKIAIKEEEIERLKDLKEVKTQKLKTNLDKIGKSIKTQYERAEVNAKKIIDIQNKITDDIIDKASKISDKSVTKSLLNTNAKIKSIDNQMNSILNKLSADDLAEAEVKKLTNQFDKLGEQADKLSKELDINLAKIRGSVDEETIKLIDKVQNKVENTNRITSTKERQLMKGEEFKARQELIKQSGNDIVSNLDKRIEKLEFQIKSLENVDDSKLLKELEDLTKSESLLKETIADRELSYNFYEGLDQMIVNFEQRATTARLYNESLMSGIFNDTEYFREITKDSKVPLGMTKVKGDDIRQTLDGFKNLIPENSNVIKDFMNKVKGGEFYMDKTLANYLNLVKSSNEQTHAFVKIINSLNNTFKRFSTLTLGFHLRNMVGNYSNLILSGVPASKTPQLFAEATSILNNANNLLKKVSNGVQLSAKEAKQWEVLQQFYEGGFAKAGTRLQDLEDLRKSAKVGSSINILDKVTDKSNEINEAVDSLGRLALLKYAMDNPNYVKKLGVKSPIEAVRFALFDPSNLTDFEKTSVKKLIPFYTFAKQNLLFQSSNIIKNTPKYNKLLKTFNKIYDGLDEDSYREYQKNNFQVPVGKDDEGNAIFLKANLPVGELGEFLSDPKAKVVNSLTPLLRTPIEDVIGKDSFTGQDIDRTPIESLARMLGINNLTTDFLDRMSKILNDGSMSDAERTSKIFNSLLQYSNSEKIRNSKQYEELENYKAYVKELKNQGINVPTINELNQRTRLATNRLKRKRTSS